MTTYTKPTLKKSDGLDLSPRERQLIARLRQLRNAGKDRAEVELAAEDGPKVKERAGEVARRGQG